MKRQPCASAEQDEGMPLLAGRPGFARIGAKGVPASRALIEKIAKAITTCGPTAREGAVLPASMLLLARLAEHDLTFGALQSETKGRMPAFDLDGIYGDGRRAPCGTRLREEPGRRLGLASVRGVTVRETWPDAGMARLRLAFLRFHNRLADRLEGELPAASVFEAARRRVTLHYQRTLRLRLLPALVERRVLAQVFDRGRSFFDMPITVQMSPTTTARRQQQDRRMAIPVEFSVAAYGLAYAQGACPRTRADGIAADPTPAFNNLARGNLLEVASGQQMADLFGVVGLNEREILEGRSGIDLSRLPPGEQLTAAQRSELVRNTPLWFYVLREAELNGGLMGDVGGRIVAEVFHRAIEVSRHSILRAGRGGFTAGLDC